MKHILISLSCFLLVSNHLAIAQNTGNNFGTPQSGTRFSPNPQQLNNAQDLFDQYNAQYRNSGLEGRNVLESVHAAGLSKTVGNVKSIRSLFASSVTSDEKVVLARILGSLYTYDDKTGMNDAIKQDLKGAVYSGQKDIARAGAFAYSRLGYTQDSNDVLLYAKNSNAINEDEYYGEIAHLVPYAPANDQINLVTKIKDGRNRYATEILAFITQDHEVMKNVYPETQKAILSSLEASEPGFAQALGEFSLIDAVRYSTWLQSIAILSSTSSNVKYENIVMAHLNDEKMDPRKIMAFLVSTEGKALIQNIGQSGTLDNALKRISLYSKQLPQNVIMKDIVQDITAAINSVKG